MRDDESICDEIEHTLDTPERRLWVSVLHQAILDATAEAYAIDVRGRQRGPSRTDHLSAQNWVDSEALAPGTFRWCCEVAGLDPEVVRERLSGRRARIGARLRHGRGYSPSQFRAGVHAGA